MTKKEIERKTEGWVKSTKEDLDRILYFVKNNEKGLGYEHAMTALQSIASYCYNLAKSFKDWSNEDRQGKLEESTSRRSFKKFVESKKVIKEETSYEGDVINVAFDNAKLSGQEFDDIHDSGFSFGKVYTWSQLEPMMIHARIPSSKIQRVKAELKKIEQMGKYDDFIYEGCKKKSVKEACRKVTESKKIVEDDSWTTADGSKIEVKQDKVFKTTKDGKKFWMPKYTWEHAFDDDGDIENGPSRREPTWFPVK